MDGRTSESRMCVSIQRCNTKYLTPGRAGTWYRLEQTPSCSELILVTAACWGRCVVTEYLACLVLGDPQLLLLSPGVTNGSRHLGKLVVGI